MKTTTKTKPPPKHLATVWDYTSNYGGELFTVRWESAVLKDLSAFAKDFAVEIGKQAGQQVLKQTIAAAIVVAAAIPMAIYGVASNIDGTWNLVTERANEAGKELARCLLFNSSQAGHRPVTLVGYSFGARVIYSCLRELARYQELWEEFQDKEKDRLKSGGRGSSSGDKKHKKEAEKEKLEFDAEPASLVEDAILMGAPIYLNPLVWKSCREMVSGRLVNVYSRKDKILSVMFRYKRLAGGYKPICGTSTVAVPGVENVNVTDIVTEHIDYCYVTGDILKRIKHGQPLRSSCNAVDEMALIEEAEQLALSEEEKGNTPEDSTT
jgi:hypothetical protein